MSHLTTNPTMLLLVVACASPLLVATIGAWRPKATSHAAIIMTALTFICALWAVAQPDSGYAHAWLKTWDISFQLELDGLAKMYVLLASGIGLAVVTYASIYMPLHLHHGHRSETELVRFYGFLLLFMAAMIGLVMAQDIILQFLFWDLTAISSYFLIGFDRAEEESRSASMMALLVTGVSAVLVLVGGVMLGQEYGTYSLPHIIAIGQLTPATPAALALISVGALAKSAQMPLHFWLPRAMAAPTPVSAYLHSAAMVAAGVYLIGRYYPLIAGVDWLLDAYMVIGFTSMLIGGLIALTRNVLKQILAYSTVSQYGYVVFLFGMGGLGGVRGATFYVLAHAIVKSALFMTAGAITEATGKKNLSEIGGLLRRMPMLAGGSALAAAGLIALPFTLGFFKDELLFARAAERGWPFMVMALIGASLSFAYTVRFWVRSFLGPCRTEPTSPSPLLVGPVVALGLIAVIGGIWPEPFTNLAARAATASWIQPVDIHVAYHLDFRTENVMALLAWAAGALLYLTRARWWNLALLPSRLGDHYGPTSIYYGGLHQLNALSDRIHDIEVRDLRSRVASVLLPAGILVGWAAIVTPNSGSFEVGSISLTDWPVVTTLIACMVSACLLTVLRDHFRLSIGLSAVGYSMATSFAFMGAPNVTIVAIVVETMTSLVILGMLILMPRPILRFETSSKSENKGIPRDTIVGAIATLFTFIVVWGVLSRPSPSHEVMDTFAVFTPFAHARNIVTVILADFRGFDTMGEITVIVITMIGVITLLRSGRFR